MVDPPFPISHLHKGEQNRIRAGDLNPQERAMLAKGEDPWAKFRGPQIGLRVPGGGSSPTEQERIYSELLQFMPKQLRAEYDKADKDRKAILWEANKQAYEAAKKRKEERLLSEQQRTAKVLDMLQRVREDPSMAHLLPPDDASMEELNKWFEKMSEPQRNIPFPSEGGRPAGTPDGVEQQNRPIPPRSSIQALQDEVDRAGEVMGRAAELLQRKTPKTRAADERMDANFSAIHSDLDRLSAIGLDSQEHWFDHGIWNNPLFLGILVMVAFAISFSPKASTLATWSCLFVAWLLATRLIYTRAAKLRHGPIIIAVLAAITLLVFFAFGWWLVIPIKSTLAESNKGAIPEQTAHSSPSSPVTLLQSDERVFIDITPEQLIGFYKKYNTVQADAVTKTYLGKWMKFSGRVGNLSREKDFSNNQHFLTIMTIFPEDFGLTKSYIAVASFDEQRWVDRVLVLGRDEKISIIGKIKRVTEPGIFLENCEIAE